MVIATILAFTLKITRITIHPILYMVVDDVAGVTTTIGFISLGINLNLGEAYMNRRSLTIGILLRMLVAPILFLPLSVYLGFRGPALCALMVLFAAPAAVTCYPLAVSMGADGPLAGQLVCTTTVLSIVTFFFYTAILSCIGLL
jgi:predicted permease